MPGAELEPAGEQFIRTLLQHSAETLETLNLGHVTGAEACLDCVAACRALQYLQVSGVSFRCAQTRVRACHVESARDMVAWILNTLL